MWLALAKLSAYKAWEDKRVQAAFGGGLPNHVGKSCELRTPSSKIMMMIIIITIIIGDNRLATLFKESHNFTTQPGCPEGSERGAKAHPAGRPAKFTKDLQ